VVQHEMDHLDGILYPDRMIDLTRFGYVEEFTKMQEQSRSPDGDIKNGGANG
jgi:peptide deformylase